jgi:hypothetical protein
MGQNIINYVLPKKEFTLNHLDDELKLALNELGLGSLIKTNGTVKFTTNITHKIDKNGLRAPQINSIPKIKMDPLNVVEMDKVVTN